MKILHLVSGGDTGGAKTHLITLLRALSSKIEVLFLCLERGPCYDEALLNGINTLALDQQGRYDLSVVGKICEIIKEGSFDILHCHGARSNFLAAKIKKQCNIPVCTTIHSDYKHDFDHSLVKKLVFTSLNKSALKKLDYYLTVTETFKKDFIDRGFRENKIRVIYNGISPNINPDNRSKSELEAEFGLPKLKAVVVGAATRMHPVKGVDVLIEATRILKSSYLKAGITELPFSVVIAGTGPFMDKYKAQVDEAKLGDTVHFIGFTKKMESFYSLIDINLLSSLSESFPYALLEGALRKKATVASDVGGIHEMIRNGVDGLLYGDNSPEKLADALKTLIEDEALRQKFAASFNERVLELFSDSAMAERHIEIYNGIISENPKKIAICGYYGYQNSGDDAILRAILHSLRSLYKPLEISILSKRPELTTKEYGYRAVNRFSLFQVLKLFKSIDVLVMGGGSLLQDKTSYRSLYYYLGLMRLAKMFKVKVILYANGLGPINGKFNRRFARNTLNKIDFLTIREKFSYDFALSLGIKEEKTAITADPVFNLAEELEPEVYSSITDRVIIANGLEGKRILGVMFRSWEHSEEYTEKVAMLCDLLTEDYGFKAVFLPMKHPADLRVSEEIRSKMRSEAIVLSERYLPEEMLAITSEMDLVLGMRLHSVIYAAIYNVPFMGFSYDPKVSYYTEELGMPLVSELEEIDFDTVSAKLRDMVENYDKYKEILGEKTEIMKMNAKLNVEHLKRLL